MKTATISKILVAAMLVAAPMVVQASAIPRDGARIGKSERQAGIGSLFAIFATFAVVTTGAVVLAAEETPTSA